MTSPRLEAMLANRRSEDQAKRERHAARMRALFAGMKAHRVTFEDFSAFYHDEWVPRATLTTDYGEYWDKTYTRRRLFQELRRNLITAKGDWWKAIDYTTADADAMRREAEAEADAEERADWRHESHLRQVVIGPLV